jgi:hypothetical protein
MQPIDINRYMALNKSYGDPFIFTLTRRGMFSEVRILLAAMIYGLLEKRRLIVETVSNTGMPWADLYATPLPYDGDDVKASIPEEWRLLGTRSAHFQTIRNYIVNLQQPGVQVRIPDLDIRGSIYDVVRAFGQNFCVPQNGPAFHAIARFAADNQLATRKFAALHLRKGDKIHGYTARDGRVIVETDDIPIVRFFETLEEMDKSVNLVLVISDDFDAVEEAAKIGRAFGKTIVSTVKPGMHGYDNTTFQGQSAEQKLRQLQDFLAQTTLALSSELFIGGFTSNVGQYIALLHQNPANCHSLDDWNWRAA